MLATPSTRISVAALIAGIVLFAARSPSVAAGAATIAPPPDSAIPNDDFGTMVRLGKAIFDDPSANAGAYVGNRLTCTNCHLESGRRADAGPMAQAYVSYPAYRTKNGHVNTFAERLQGCFEYSMNGKAPPFGGKILVALESYAYFLAKDMPTGAPTPGRGYPAVPAPPRGMDVARGGRVFAAKCAACHGVDGGGQTAGAQVIFPALWGAPSFNWGAGMAEIDNAVGFIKANMPLGQGYSLSDQEAWDVAAFVDSHERPQDPRFVGTVAATRAAFHDTPMSMYGRTVDGLVLGAHAPPARPAPP